MNFMNPRMTIQNAVGNNWLVTFEYQFSENETIVFTVTSPKDGKQTMADMEKSVIARAVKLLQNLEHKTG